MDIFYAVFLGVLQGATEFLPISSSAHLALAELYLGIKQAGLTFDIALHLGSLLAVIIHFRTDLWMMGRAVLAYSGKHGEEERRLRALALYICLATVPAVVAALLFGNAAESVLRQPWIIAITLTVGAGLLLWADKTGTMQRGIRSVTLPDALLIGLAQAFALIPGVSRSGITITAGLFLGLDREAVARFSFLLAIPVILGAGVHHIPDLLQQGAGTAHLPFFLAGFLAAALSGYLFIAFLLKLIRTRTFAVFVYYRILLAGILLFDIVRGG